MEAGRENMDIAKYHAATVTATLNAVNAYAEWAPLSDLAKYGIIHWYGCFLSCKLQLNIGSVHFLTPLCNQQLWIPTHFS